VQSEYVKQETIIKQAEADFVFGLFFVPESGVDMFLRNDCSFSLDYMGLYPRR
jgi:hypothetical protein